MAKAPLSVQDEKVVRLFGVEQMPTEERSTSDSKSGGGGGGGGSMDDVIRRVGALETNLGEIRSLLKDLKDGQHSAAMESVAQKGDLNTRLAEFSGKLTNLDTKADGLRRDVDKLPTEFGVAKILVFVITGLGAAAALLKVGIPVLTKLLT